MLDHLTDKELLIYYEQNAAPYTITCYKCNGVGYLGKECSICFGWGFVYSKEASEAIVRQELKENNLDIITRRKI